MAYARATEPKSSATSLACLPETRPPIDPASVRRSQPPTYNAARMSDQPQDAGAPPRPQVSADGLWVWNGTAWVANPSPSPQVPVPYYPPPAPMQYPLLAYPAAGGYAVAPKNPAVSLIVSLFIPGVGSLINGDTGIGITILLLWLLSIVLDFTVIGVVVGVPLGLGVFIWGLIDAYQGAQRWNRQHGIIS